MSRHHLHLLSLCGLLFVLVGVTLLTYRVELTYHIHEIVPRQLQPAIHNISNSSTSLRSIAQPFGHRDHIWDFSRHQIHTKRALGEQFSCLIQKGKQYWEQGVLPAFDAESRFPNPFSNTGGETQIQDLLLDSGWTSNDDNSQLGEHWKEAFRNMAGGVPDDSRNVIRIFLDQSMDFENDHGQQRATSATYHGLYIPHNGAIIIFLSVSPRNKVERRRVPPESIPTYIPRLNQLSDLVWLAWDNLVENPEVLRYYAVERIFNAVSGPLMDEIFRQRRGTTGDIPWSRRITFDLDSDKGTALFASPNGVAVHWLLIHHAVLLGRRRPRVTIFNPGGSNRCMIWDLVPEGGQGSFGNAEMGSGG
ncbi:MAG: hypothetical protein Q9169_003992 [Polycauliona sp. 2 TL-2023]